LGRPIVKRYAPARSFDVPISVLDIERARAALSWSPKVDFLDGVVATLSGLRQTG
jgi:UDP-glucose 4-epimerase